MAQRAAKSSIPLLVLFAPVIFSTLNTLMNIKANYNENVILKLLFVFGQTKLVTVFFNISSMALFPISLLLFAYLYLCIFPVTKRIIP